MEKVRVVKSVSKSVEFTAQKWTKKYNKMT